jgi:hypothetical protein
MPTSSLVPAGLNELRRRGLFREGYEGATPPAGLAAD